MIYIQQTSRLYSMLVGAANIIDGAVRVLSLGTLFTRLPAKALGIALRAHFKKQKELRNER